MRFLPLILAIISLGLVSYSSSKPPYCAVDTLSNLSNITDSISDLKEKEESKEDMKSLSEFRSVIDTLNSDRDPLVHASFFLYDITNDGKEDLWIKSGRCEGDYQLRAYSMESGNPRKIYEGDGGHSDFFIYDGQLVCVMCNTGAGGVITYRYDGKRVIDSIVYFITRNENGSALSEPHDSIADEKLKYWEDSFGNYIELKPL